MLHWLDFHPSRNWMIRLKVSISNSTDVFDILKQISELGNVNICDLAFHTRRVGDGDMAEEIVTQWETLSSTVTIESEDWIIRMASLRSLLVSLNHRQLLVGLPEFRKTTSKPSELLRQPRGSFRAMKRTIWQILFMTVRRQVG
jgi:hypothetical protein